MRAGDNMAATQNGFPATDQRSNVNPLQSLSEIGEKGLLLNLIYEATFTPITELDKDP